MTVTKTIARANLDQILAGLKNGDPAAINAARLLLTDLINVSSALELSVLLMPIELVLEVKDD